MKLSLGLVVGVLGTCLVLATACGNAGGQPNLGPAPEYEDPIVPGADAGATSTPVGSGTKMPNG